MPELPEVETVVRDLRPLLVGRTITTIRRSKQNLRRAWRSSQTKAVIGATVTGIRRRGKWIIVALDRSAVLVFHLGMTGQLTVIRSDEPRPDHLHFVFELDNRTELRFRDTRRFGSVEYSARANFAAESRLGPEPFDLNPEAFRSGLTRSARNLKAILLDQRFVAGIGNIYADEACFRAQLNPRRQGKSLSAAECERLRQAIEVVLTRAIASRGSTIRDYIGGSGLRGGFQNEFAVYGRTGEPCRVCRSEVKCVRLAGRASHYCPACQPTSSSRKRRAMRWKP